MIKNIYDTTISLISKPSDTWAKLEERQENDREAFLSNYIYPFVGLVTISAFVGILFTRREFDAQIALKASVMSLLSVMGGFFLASYFVNELWNRMFHRERDIKLCMCFVGYSSLLAFVLNIFLSLFPELFFLRFSLFYTIKIVWDGAIPYMKVKEAEQLKFVSYSTAIITLTPIILEFILGQMMPGLRF